MLIIFLLFYEPSAMFITFSLKSIKKQLLDLVYGFLHLKCITKQLLDEVLVICRIINVEVRVISLAFGSADTLGSPLIDGIFLVQKMCIYFCVYSVYNFIDYARSSSMPGQLVMHQCLHHVYIGKYIYMM